MQSTFYPTNQLSLDERVAILMLAKEKCYQWWVDKLDCRESFHRQKTEMSFEEIMGQFNDRCGFNMIYRQFDHEKYLEVSFRTMSPVDYFLWLLVDVCYIPEFERILPDQKEEPKCSTH